MAKKNDSRVNYEWANRPDDQRYLNLVDLRDAVSSRTSRMVASPSATNRMLAIGTEEGQLLAASDAFMIAGTSNPKPFTFTNWSFGQLAGAAGAPAAYLRKLPSPLAADCLNYGLRRERDENLLLLDNGDGEGVSTLRAITSVSYGRIWDLDIVDRVIQLNESCGNRWIVPSASYSRTDPRRATTLYASDRDIFMFLCDERNPIEFDGRTMKRGFYVWNSEVGSAIFGIACFLYDLCCDNRNLWGVEGKIEMRIRHTSGAPERFVREASPALTEYAESSTEAYLNRLKKAKALEVGKTDNEVLEWIKNQGFTAQFSKRVFESAMAEEGRCASLWDISNGMTALARAIPNQDARVDMERTAGKLVTKYAA